MFSSTDWLVGLLLDTLVGIFVAHMVGMQLNV